ncbi:hypothetical protein MMC12_006768 [Toensbergia leucococca]|nr:hypothetical protein [Toensbergia leucococca]
MQSTNGHGDLHLPIIDTSKTDFTTGQRLIDAASKWGFLYVRSGEINITPDIIDHIFTISKKFFQSPVKEKAECAVSVNNNWGWLGIHSEKLDVEHQKQGDFKEAINFGEFVNGKAQQPMPKSLAAHEAEIGQFAMRCNELCMKLLRLFACGLQIDEADGGESWFSSRHDPSKGPSGSVLRLLHYPAIETCEFLYDAAVDVRAGAHSDYGSITLLFQRPSQPGLEILTPESDWAPVPVFPAGTENDAFPPILVNIGDLLSYWTNGLLKSTVHRVVVPQGSGEDRYSIAYFCHPVDSVKLVSVPSELVDRRVDGSERAKENRNAEEPMTAEEHLKERLAATYGWAKE